MRTISSNTSRILATILLMFLLLGALQGLYSYDETKYREAEHLEQVTFIKELQWLAVESIITDNYNNAQTLAIGIKYNIEERIILAYPDRARLVYDLDNPRSYTPASTIFAQEIKGKYLNDITNDNNDPFIASRNGILSDLSLNCSSENRIRSWETEISMHTNQLLAQQAVDAIVNQSDKPIFWEFMKSKNSKHIIITEMTLAELHKVFIKEGLEGLSTYEFLKPVYIQQHTDVFGIADVDNIGVKNKNSKIIPVSGFNVYDIISKYHRSTMEKYNTALIILNRDYQSNVRRSNFIHVSILIVLLFCMAITAMINNYVVSTQEENAKKENNKQSKD